VIEGCVKRANLKIADPNQHAPNEKALALLQALSGDPTGNPYYKALWEAFAEPVELPKDKGQLNLLGADPHLFHADFRFAYLEALATPDGQQVQRWCLSLAAEKREVMRHILAEDLAAWGTRHVFGNVRRQAAGDPMPFLSLDDSYIEPRGRYKGREEPILGLVSGLLEEHALVVVRADFGHGKSLTARRLARDVARAWLKSRQPAGASQYPVFIKCSRDLRDPRYDHDAVVRSALWHAAEEAVADRPAMKDEAFAPLESDRAALFILDGLDEVALTRHHLEDLFKDLQAALGPGQRVVVFTRPGALRDERCLPKATPVVNLLEFDDGQIAEWVERWNRLSGKVPVEVDRLHTLGVASLARTPILLLMIVVTWEEHLANASQVNKVSLYEHFFQHIARGKYQGAGEDHEALMEASSRLARELQRRGILQEEQPVEAMLWLMSRVAWEAHTFAYGQPARDLQARDMASLLYKELGMEDSVTLDSIEVGLLLAMQIDPTGASKTILFGHQSFREFLVARYWKRQLLRLVTPETKQVQRSMEESLMQARLLQDEDEAFYLLIEMLWGLDAVTRQSIKEWAQKYIQIDELTLHLEVKTDRRPMLRESALAIGSYIEPDEGLQLDESALRFLCCWYQFHGQTALIWAPGLRSPHSLLERMYLIEAHLRGAHLEGANLREVNLVGANLVGANLVGANLVGANLVAANCDEANLAEADLAGADLEAARFAGANFAKANLAEVDLEGAYLARANLAGAYLAGANLAGANLAGANLAGAYLEGADLSEANLSGANLSEAYLEGANLNGAVFQRADLKGVVIRRNQLANADIDGAFGLDEMEEIPDLP
jgi:uncharacterized protein YjbI with pentapeptide repeats